MQIKAQNLLKKEKGITLVALVITIVILIILATVTIKATFGENGLIKKAQEAKEMTTNSIRAEEEGINELLAEYANIIAEDSETPEVPEKSEIQIAKENGTKYTETTPLKDDLDNVVYVPGGFKLAEDSGTKVEEGIIIEDDDGNQFVWIPTGKYKVSTTLSSTGTLINELTRRQWGTTANIVQEPIPIKRDEVAEGNQGAHYYGEGDNRSCTIVNGINSIDAFLASAKPVLEGGHGGFYVGRYEQGKDNVCKAQVDVYVSITRDEAKNQAEAMYSERSDIKATSQLISSYAWDTTLNFICQTNIGEGKGYALATTTSQDRANIGTGIITQTGKYLADCYSNIYDLLGNCYEWTTEYSDFWNGYNYYPCISRGGGYDTSIHHYAGRYNGREDDTYIGNSFRLQLYV